MAENVIEFSILAKDQMSGVLRAGTAALAAWTVALGFAQKAIIDVGSENEKMRIRLNALLGDVAEGNKVFKDMAEFAGEVPFAYEEIMQSATTLSGVLKDGSEEIKQFMPIIADLAAVSGLSIQQTTEQIVRMYSAGAGAADLFRERGINAMLGFEAGVAVSAEETRRRLIAAFEDPLSKFRGASLELATTWEGILSMISDKYRAIKVLIADEGIFNFFKALAIQIDRLMGAALENTANNAKEWSNFLIDSIRAVGSSVNWLSNQWRNMGLVFDWLEKQLAELTLFFSESIFAIAEKLEFIDTVLGTNVINLENLERAMLNARQAAANLGSEFAQAQIDFTESQDSLANFMDEVEITFADLQAKSEAMNEAVKKPADTMLNETMGVMASLREEWPNFLSFLHEANENFAINFFKVMDRGIKALSRGIADVLVEGRDMGKMLVDVAKLVLKSFIATLVELGIQRLVLAGINKASTAAENAQLLAGGYANAFTNAFAATAAIPIVGPALAPGVAAASLAAVTAGSLAAGAAGAAAGLTMGIAHGGFDNIPAESSFLIKGGERVLSPAQNTDLTEFLSGEGSGGNVTIENLEVVVLPNATNADALLSMSPDEIEDIVAGPIIDALNALTKKGINPDFIERDV